MTKKKICVAVNFSFYHIVTCDTVMAEVCVKFPWNQLISRNNVKMKLIRTFFHIVYLHTTLHAKRLNPLLVGTSIDFYFVKLGSASVLYVQLFLQLFWGVFHVFCYSLSSDYQNNPVIEAWKYKSKIRGVDERQFT